MPGGRPLGPGGGSNLGGFPSSPRNPQQGSAYIDAENVYEDRSVDHFSF